MKIKDFIIYILENDLENEDISFLINKAIMTTSEYAAVKNVGESTVQAWYLLGLLPGINIKGTIYILKRKDDEV